MNTETTWSVFTKPWPMHTARDLSGVVAGLGFDGVELPVRNGTFVTAKTAPAQLPGYVEELRERGVKTISIAADLGEPVFAACQAAAVPLIRIMVPVADNHYATSFRSALENLQRTAKWAQEYGVGVAIQPHRGPFLTSTLSVMNLLDGLPEEWFGIAWDAAHDALAGDDPATTLPMAGRRLLIANLKNVVYTSDAGTPTAGTSGKGTQWKPWYVPGPEGLANWPSALHQLRAMEYQGPICLTAQYSDTSTPVEQLLREDLEYARSIWNGPASR